MRVKKRTKKRIVICGFSLIAAAVLCTVFFSRMGTASAATTSLPHIQQIVQSGEDFNILEVVPDKTACNGSIGYYVSGQEPFQSWYVTFSDTKTYPNPAARTTYANKLLSDLYTSGLLSKDSSSAPLLYSGASNGYTYTEKYPWEFSDNTATVSFGSTLQLSAEESATVTGTVNQKTGYYDGIYQYVLKKNASYVQTIDSFTYAADGSSAVGVYYYQPTFTLITADTDPATLNGTAVYTLQNGNYVYYGTVSDTLELDATVDYYYVTATGAPQATAGSGYNYAANSKAFSQASGTGYFDRSIKGYRYNAAGTGDFSFVPKANGTSYTLYTSTVYEQGIITNNNWFQNDVFDSQSASFQIKVNTITPDQLTDSMINNADLIFLSAGFNPASPTTSYASSYTAKDLTATQAYSIYYTAMSSSRPLIVDERLTTGSTNVARLAKLSTMASPPALNSKDDFSNYSLTNYTPLTQTNFVSKNVFCINSNFNLGTVTAANIATPNFVTSFSSSVISSGFSDVLAEIQNENFLRKVADPNTKDLLPENVTIGNTIRYIINYSGQRVTTKKQSIKILDLEPGKTSSSSALTKAKVEGWLNNAYTDNQITIVTMSSAEFIGKIEDLSETYDMIYLGASLEGFNQYNNSTVYNDTSMNGLIYCNIGDSYTGTTALSGLVSSDTSTPTFRFSGNDITKEKYNELLTFANAGYPVVIANDLQYLKSATDTTFNVNATDSISGSTVTLNAAAVDSSNNAVSATYEWYSKSSPTGTATLISSSASCSVSPTATAYYYCVATATQTSKTAAVSSTIKITYGNLSATNNSSSTWTTGNYDSGWSYRNFYTSISPLPATGSSITLTATPIDYYWSSNATLSNPSYSWRDSNGNQVGSGSTYTLSSSGTYYCIITNNISFFNSSSARSQSFTVSKALADTTDVASKSAGSFTNSGAVNTAHVDCNSYMYKAISGMNSLDNVKSASDVSSTSLLNFLNLSKPQIVFDSTSDYPTVYSDTMNQSLPSVNGAYYLTYNFTIKNDTDPTPATTTYNCELFLDINSDGKYSSDEMLSDLTVTLDGQTVSPSVKPDGSQYYSLSANKKYTITRQLPDAYAGIIPWKLTVTKNGASGIHASVHNYTHIVPNSDQKKTINILQIAPDSVEPTTTDCSKNTQSNSTNLNLQNQMLSSSTGTNSDLYSSTTGKYYHGVYGKLLADVPDFKVNIVTIKAGDLESMGSSKSSSTPIYNYFINPDNNASTDDGYTMLIIGFADSYGTIGQYTASAITQYIDSGQSVLFTHDTTSFNITSGWGVYFNSIIRDKVGLDRYGITSNDTIVDGGTATTVQSLLKSGKSLTSDQISTILNDGYSIAYKPTVASSTLVQTQGITSYNLMRYRNSSVTQKNYTNWSGYVSSGSISTTNHVSQINEGQITTYPYNVNTSAFDSSKSSQYFNISTTHEQYYQVNMNSDDIVVWYCLTSSSGDTSAFNDIPNDCTNAYYIYSRGNVTYSGMGHSAYDKYYTLSGASSTSSTAANYYNEAKLFVNTMIAAYQAGKQAPTVSIKSSSAGTQDTSYLYSVSDFSATGSASSSTNKTNQERALYFKVSDSNLDPTKIIAASFSYGSANTPFTAQVLLPDGSAVTSASLSSGIVYMIYLPDDVYTALNASSTGMIPITVKTTTTIGTTSLSGSDAIELRKIDMFNLH